MKKYILIHIQQCGRVSDKKNLISLILLAFEFHNRLGVSIEKYFGRKYF